MASAEELARVAVALEEVRHRILKRHEIELAMKGSDAAERLSRAGFQPLINAAIEARMDPVPEYPDSRIVANQNI